LAATPRNGNSPRRVPEIFRKHPGRGYRHVLLARHVRAFLGILPDWNELSVGLNTILLAPAKPGCDGLEKIFAGRRWVATASNPPPLRGLAASSCTPLFRATKIFEFLFSKACFWAFYRIVTIYLTVICASFAR
jgi:hypothetical protein